MDLNTNNATWILRTSWRFTQCASTVLSALPIVSQLDHATILWTDINCFHFSDIPFVHRKFKELVSNGTGIHTFEVKSGQTLEIKFIKLCNVNQHDRL